MSESNKILFFGCSRGMPGHNLNEKIDGYPRSRIYESTAWGRDLDGGLLNGFLPDQIDGRVAVHHKDDWTAIAFWDRTGDKRPGSNSAFLIAADISGEALLAGARREWPEFFKRGHPWNALKIEPAKDTQP